MEHLVRPTSAASQPYETVANVGKEYDGGDFLTYPVRAGKPHILHSPYDQDSRLYFWQRERQNPTPTQELEPFFQTWLFFGLINEILGDLCTAEDFVRTAANGNSKLIITSQLPTILNRWVQGIRHGGLKSSYNHIAECLRLTHSVLYVASSTFDANLKFSLVSVGELLEYAVNDAFPIQNFAKDNRCPGNWRSLLSESTWIPSMQRQGWCPSQLALLLPRTCSVQLVYFLTHLSLPEVPGHHVNCDQYKCIAHQIDLTKYKTRHVTTDCSCKHVQSDVSAIDSILQSGRFPLLRVVQHHPHAQLSMDIVASEASSRYVAISHVWADGLGNPTENALPQCQLRHLRDLVENLDLDVNAEGARGDLLLWCDTLCCPVAPEEAKNRALAYMRRTYEDATHVLALDTSLQHYDSASLSTEEMCVRIVASGWMRRLWTLQEGSLPGAKDRLWFQFRDKAVNFQSLWQIALDMFNDQINLEGIEKGSVGHMLAFASFFRDSEHDMDGEVVDLALMDSFLRYRSVSVSSDEPLLIGNLLGLPVERILNGSKETRIHRMWSLIGTVGIPKSILFRLGPRLQTQAFRWAPSTMLFPEDTNSILFSVPKGDNRGVPSPFGLQANFAGYALSWPSRPKGLPSNPWNIIQDEGLLYMRSENGVWYRLRRRVSSTSPAEGDFLSHDNLNDIVRSTDDLCMIHLETDFQARPDAADQSSLSLLVKLVEEKAYIRYVQSYMHFQVGLLETGGQCMFETAYRCAQQVRASEVAQQLADTNDSDVDMDNADYKALFDKLFSEIIRLAGLEENQAALAVAAGRSGNNGTMLFGATVAKLFIGHYAIMGTMSTESQSWCVD